MVKPIADIAATISPTSQRMQRRIIDAVVEVIAKDGLSRATLARVAETAGVSQGVLVFHFNSKEDLFAETLRRFINEYERAWRRAAAEQDPLQRILALIRADFSPTICSRKKLALWFAFWGEASARPLFNKICVEAELARGRAMAEACRAYCGAFSKAYAGANDPAFLAHCIDAMIDGLWLQLHMNWKRVSRDAALRQAVDHAALLLPYGPGAKKA